MSVAAFEHVVRDVVQGAMTAVQSRRVVDEESEASRASVTSTSSRVPSEFGVRSVAGSVGGRTPTKQRASARKPGK